MADNPAEILGDDLDLLEVPEVAALLKCCPATVWSYIKSGELPSLKIGPKARRVTCGQYREYIKSRMAAAAKAA